MAVKIRKPRMTDKKIKSADHFLTTMHKIINMLTSGTDNDVIAVAMEYSKDIKAMEDGKEFLEDLVKWQRWRINANKV